MFVRKKLKLM